MDVSIIIVNYNTNQLTCNCIGSIYTETTDIDFEIIVVDNASQREDPHMIRKKYPLVNLIINKENEGFGRANNIGISHAKGTYILLLNSDTIILDKAINKCFSFMKSNFASERNIGLLGCTLLNSDLTIQPSVFGKENIHAYIVNGNPIMSKLSAFIRKKEPFDFSKMQPVSGIAGAFMFFKAEVFERIAPFDPDIFMYSEETELCRRRIRKHYNIMYWPGARILHYSRQSGEKEVMHHQNMLSTALTWYKKSIPHYLLYFVYSTINSMLLIISFPLAREKSKKEIASVLKGYVKILPYLLFDIPKYVKDWGSRKQPLKLKELS